MLCGPGVTWENRELAEEITALGLPTDHLHLLGRRENIIPLLDAALILVLSSSHGEAFPVVLGESMACGTVCVTTNVGDCAAIVGDTGFVVPPRNPEAIAEACLRVLDLDVAAIEGLRSAARHRAQEVFALPDVVDQYEALYRKVALVRQ